MASPSLLTVHLRGSASPPDAASSVAIEVEGGDGVDLAQVGLALGLDPATVGLNGYFLNCGSGYVSLAVTWGELIAFFAAGGQPTGADPSAPVAVDGGPAPSPPEPTVLLSTKRKSGIETENGSKKSKLQHNSSSQSKAGEELLTDEITLGLKRRLRLDEAGPSKKTKQVDYSSGSEHNSQLNTLAASPAVTTRGHQMRRWSPHCRAREYGDASLFLQVDILLLLKRTRGYGYELTCQRGVVK